METEESIEKIEYKRIPVLPETKKKFDHAKIDSGCETQDEFLNELLDFYDDNFKDTLK